MAALGRGAVKRPRWRGWPFWVFLAAAVFAAPAGRLPAAEPSANKEYRVKATYLFNFAKFVEWPPPAFAESATPIRIGVLGNDDFGLFLDQLVQGETVKGHPLVVKRSRLVEELKTCHILFISKSEANRIDQILTALGDAGVLTVSESDGFAERGGIVNFFIEGNKVRFEINPAAARRRELKIGSQLLSLARIVSPTDEKEKP